MSRYVFPLTPALLNQLSKLPNTPMLIVEPAAKYEMAIMLVIPRGYAGQLLSLLDGVEPIRQSPAVSSRSALEDLRQKLSS